MIKSPFLRALRGGFEERHRDAVDALEKATRLMPTARYAWKHLAEAYQGTGRSADAQRAAARAQQLGGAIASVSKKKT